MFSDHLLTLGVAGAAAAWLLRCSRNKTSNSNRLFQEEMRKKFISSLQASDQRVLDMLAPLKAKICSEINTEKLVLELQEMDATNSERLALWEQLKCASFSQLFTAVISAAYISLITRVHYCYISGKDKEEFVDPVLYFVLHGVPKLAEDVHQCVYQQVRSLTLKQSLERQQFKVLIRTIEVSLTDIIKNITEYIVPISVSGYTDDSMLALHDVLSLQDTKDVLQNLIDVCISYICNIITQDIKTYRDGEKNAEFVAKIIPVLTHAVDKSYIPGNDGIFYQVLTDKDLSKLSSNIFECFAA